jgi:hypothetical protein
MEENLLSFREWSDNFVRVKYDLNWFEATILSFDEKIDFVDGKEEVKLLFQSQSKHLLKYYKKNFDKIQNQFLNQTI